jgi:hypothetical protein
MDLNMFNLDDLGGGAPPPLPVEKAKQAVAPETPKASEPKSDKAIPPSLETSETPPRPAENKPDKPEEAEAPVEPEEEDEENPEDEEDENEDEETEEEKKATEAEKGTKPAEPKQEGEKEKKRDLYTWGQCPVTVTVQIMKADENPKGQLVRVGVHSHNNPTEPPKIDTFRIEPLPHPLTDAFWKTLRGKVNVLIETMVKELPDREATWKANKKHKQDPTPAVRNAAGTAHTGARKPVKSEDKKKPPSITNTTMELF